MTPRPPTDLQDPDGVAKPLEYAHVLEHAEGAHAALARNIVAISLKCLGGFILLMGLWEAVDTLFSSLLGLAGLTQDYWSGLGDIFRETVIYPADSYLMGVLLIVLADRIAPWLMPRRWWR